jgi:phage shock protein PspC (stress-responsive transcriptional regulator)
VRLAFIVGTLWGGLGLLVYVILAFVLPVDF